MNDELPFGDMPTIAVAKEVTCHSNAYRAGSDFTLAAAAAAEYVISLRQNMFHRYDRICFDVIFKYILLHFDDFHSFCVNFE